MFLIVGSGNFGSCRTSAPFVSGHIVSAAPSSKYTLIMLAVIYSEQFIICPPGPFMFRSGYLSVTGRVLLQAIRPARH